MTFFEFCKDLIDNAKERIKNPLVSAFFITFIICNWRMVLYLLFSADIIELKISNLEDKYINGGTFFIPLIYALAYLIVLPFVSYFLSIKLYPIEKERKSAKNQEKIDIIGNKIKLVDVQLQLQDKQSRNKEREELLDKITSLEQQIETNKSTLKETNKTHKMQIEELTTQLNQSRKIIDYKNETQIDKDLYRLYLRLLTRSNLKNHDIRLISSLPTGESVSIQRYVNEDIKGFLEKNHFAQYKFGILILSAEGKNLVRYLKDLVSEDFDIRAYTDDFSE